MLGIELEKSWGPSDLLFFYRADFSLFLLFFGRLSQDYVEADERGRRNEKAGLLLRPRRPFLRRDFPPPLSVLSRRCRAEEEMKNNRCGARDLSSFLSACGAG